MSSHIILFIVVIAGIVPEIYSEQRGVVGGVLW